MLTQGHAARRYVTLYQAGDADTDTVAALLTQAADRLQRLGPATVRHLALEVVDDLGRSETALTVYFD